ncbi:hypothetical protein ES703_113539 [subsurface metagenome]
MGHESTKVALDSLGCKLNQAETELLARQLAEAGYRLVSPTDKADVYIPLLILPTANPVIGLGWHMGETLTPGWWLLAAMPSEPATSWLRLRGLTWSWAMMKNHTYCSFWKSLVS